MTEGKQKIKFAVIGCGHIGKRHVNVIQKNPSAELIAVVDENLSSFNQQNLNAAKKFNSLNDLLNDKISKNIDVISIATPNGSHAQIALQCLNAKKHIVLEKPMTLTRAEAEQIIFKSLDVHRHVFVVKQNRYSPPSQWLKKIVTENILGKIYLVQLNCYWNRDERYYTDESWHGSKKMDGGTLFTQFSHFIDIMFWIFGDIKNIEAKIHNYKQIKNVEFEDCGIAQFEFLNGGLGSINFSTAVWDKNMESSITVITENGSLKIGGQYINILEYCHIKNFQPPQFAEINAANNYGAYQGSAANHQFIFENVINVLQNGSSISANVLEGMKVVDIIERIYFAASQNK
ncbi:MAG: Gfo/Idh/MocA family protein [Chitinophagaceae bacterium]